MYEDAIKTSGNADRIELRELTELIEEALRPEGAWPRQRERSPAAHRRLGKPARLRRLRRGRRPAAATRRGGLPLSLPQLPEAIEPALDAIDGLLLAPDGTSSHAATARSLIRCSPRPSLRADAFELTLVPAAIDRGLPILGMCRGIQTLNVALGGTLVQDVSLVSAEHPSDPGWTSWSRSRRPCWRTRHCRHTPVTRSRS